MIRVTDFGEVAYGGAVTLTEWWDNKRIAKGTISSKDVFKKASFYTYLGVGLTATLMSVFGWMRRYEGWAEKVSTGFLYDLPRFAYNMVRTLSSGSKSDASAAVKEAQRIVAEKQNLQLTQGRHSSYQSANGARTGSYLEF